jgi:hypothetical protein
MVGVESGIAENGMYTNTRATVSTMMSKGFKTGEETKALSPSWIVEVLGLLRMSL